jgi:hypothetical protein
MFRYDAPSSAWVADGTFKGTTAYSFLGTAVALSGTSALVGSPDEDNGTTADAGSARVLVRGASTWSQEGATLRGALTTGSHFGSAVAISGDYAVVGAPSASSGFAYVFHRATGTWSIDATLAPSLAAPELAEFGAAVAIDGTHLVIGAPRQDGGVFDAGMVHAYRRELDGWTNSHAIGATNPSISKCGASVTLDGEWFAAGAPSDGASAKESGSVYVFR